MRRFSRLAAGAAAVLVLSAFGAACASEGYYDGYEDEGKFNMLVSAYPSGGASSYAPAVSTAPASAAEAEYGSLDNVGTELADEGGSVTIGPVSTERKIIVTVDLEMESTEYDACATNIYRLIEAAGGYIEYSDIRGDIVDGETVTGALGAAPGLSVMTLGTDEYRSYYDGRPRSMRLVIRIPQNGLSGFIAELNSHGQILSRTETAEDITLKYVDMEAHKRALQAEQEQLISMLGIAGSIEEMIKRQERLAEVRYKIESYESQLRVMENQVSYATVNISLNEVIVYTEQPEIPVPNPTIGERIAKGFNRTIQNIRNYWINKFIWVAVNSVYIAGVVIGAAAAVFLARRYIKRLPKREAAKPPAFEDPDDAREPDGDTPGASGEQDNDNDGGSKKKLTGSKHKSRYVRLKAYIKGLFVPPFAELDRIIGIVSLIHAGTVIFVPFFNWISDSMWNAAMPIQYLMMLTAMIFFMLHSLTYLSIPATVAALVYRQSVLRRSGYGGRLAYGLVGTVLLIILQVALAASGWTLWQNMMF